MVGAMKEIVAKSRPRPVGLDWFRIVATTVALLVVAALLGMLSVRAVFADNDSPECRCALYEGQTKLIRFTWPDGSTELDTFTMETGDATSGRDFVPLQRLNGHGKPGHPSV